MKNDLKRLYNMMILVKKYWVPYIISTIGVSSRNLFINLLNAMLFSSVVISAQNHSTDLLFNSIIKFIIVLVIFVILDSMFLFLQSHTLNKMINHIKHSIFEAILNAPMNDIHKIGECSELMSRINSDVESAGRVYGNGIINPLLCLISGVGSIVVIVKINWVLLLWACVIGISSLIINVLIGKKLRGVLSRSQKNKAQLLLSFSETFSNGMIIKLLNLFNPMYSRFQNGVDDYEGINKDEAKLEALWNMLNAIEAGMQYTGTIILGVYLFSKNAIKLSDIIVAAQMVGLVSMMFTSFGNAFVNLQRSLVGAERIFELLNFERENKNVIFKEMNFNKDDTIVFKDLTVCYSSESYILKSLNGRIESDTLTVISGASGKGKSTLLKVILGFYPYERGSIKLWGRELKEYTVGELRSLISYVPQNDVIVEGTIKDNILFGLEDKNVSQLVIEKAAKTACIHEFICSLPNGYNTKISDQNIELSGGQRQCIAMARALLNDKPLLLFDEPFSAMGFELAEKIINNIKREEKLRTILMVSHDTNASKWGNSFVLN